MKHKSLRLNSKQNVSLAVTKNNSRQFSHCISASLCVCVRVCLSVWVLVYLCMCLCTHVSVYILLSVHVFCVSVCVCVYLMCSMCVCVCLNGHILYIWWINKRLYQSKAHQSSVHCCTLLYLSIVYTLLQCTNSLSWRQLLLEVAHQLLCLWEVYSLRLYEVL